jgi:hypothetical protein
MHNMHGIKKQIHRIKRSFSFCVVCDKGWPPFDKGGGPIYRDGGIFIKVEMLYIPL